MFGLIGYHTCDSQGLLLFLALCLEITFGDGQRTTYNTGEWIQVSFLKGMQTLYLLYLLSRP